MESEDRLEDLIRQLGNVVGDLLKTSREHQEAIMAMYTVLEKSDSKFASQFNSEMEQIRRNRPAGWDKLDSQKSTDATS